MPIGDAEMGFINFDLNQLAALLTRCGFDINYFNNLDFDIGVPNENGESTTVKEKYFCILVTKQRPLYIK